jgi:hypothetical protein
MWFAIKPLPLVNYTCSVELEELVWLINTSFFGSSSAF